MQIEEQFDYFYHAIQCSLTKGTELLKKFAAGEVYVENGIIQYKEDNNMKNTLWITEYEMNGEEHRFYYLGDTTDNDACSTACYNTVAVGEDGEKTYKEIRTWNDIIYDYTNSFVEELKANGYIIR